MTRHDPLVYLLHMRDDIEQALRMSRGRSRADFDDEMFAYAMAFLVGRIDVTAAKVPGEVQERFAEVPWQEVIGVRERILASEGLRNDDIVWQTVTEVLPNVLSPLEDAIEDLRKVGHRY